MALLRTTESRQPGEIHPPLLEHVKREPLPTVAPEILGWQRKPFTLYDSRRNDYTQLSKADIASCLGIVRTDPMVRTAIKTISSSLFRGGILVMGTSGDSYGDQLLEYSDAYDKHDIGIDAFVAASASDGKQKRTEGRGKGTGKGKSKDTQDDEDEYLSRILDQFATDMHEYMQAIGFCPWVAVPNDHPVYRYRPQRLNVEKVSVWYKCNLFSESMFAFTTTADGIDELEELGILGIDTALPFAGDQFVIPGVFVEVWHKPDSQGRLTSPVMPLIEPLEIFGILKHCHLTASLAASAPVHIIQSKPPIDLGLQNRGILQDAVEAQNDMNARPGALRDNAGPRRVEGVVNRAMEQLIRIANQWQGGPHQFDKMRVDLIRSLNQSINNVLKHRVYLDDYEELGKPPESKSPVDFIKTQLLMQQTVFMAFSLPPAMIQAESVRGRMNLDYNAMRVFNDAQQQLMVDVQRALQHVAEGIWSPARLARYAVDTPLVQQISEEEARRKMKIRVVIPSIPSPDDVRALYQEGVLRYDAYCGFMGQIYSIPRDRFEDKPRDVMGAMQGQGQGQGQGQSRMGIKAATKQSPAAQRGGHLHLPTITRQREQRAKLIAKKQGVRV